MQTTLVLNALLGLATAALYALVGTTMSRRQTTSVEAETAKRSFTLWWWPLAGASVISSAQQLLAAFGFLAPSVHNVLTFLIVGFIMFAIAGLLQYIVYLHLGTLRFHRPILIAQLVLAVVLGSIILWLEPQGISTSDWSVTPAYGRAVPGWYAPFTLATIVLPVTIASLAYLTLAFRTHIRVARFRILSVAGAFLFWFGSAGAASALGWSAGYWWPLVSRGIGVVATGIILFAYHPPRRLEERLNAADDEAALREQGERPRRPRSAQPTARSPSALERICARATRVAVGHPRRAQTNS